MKNSPPASARLASLQMLRGIAASLVVLLHSIDIADGFPSAFSGPFLPNLPRFHDFGASGVDLFFVISGFAMSASISGGNRTSWQFMRQRIIRVVPLYWLAAGSFALIAGMYNRPDACDGLINIMTILPLFDTLRYESPALFVGWSLMFEFIFYAQVAIVLTWKPATPLRWLFLLTLVCALVSTVLDGPVLAKTVFNPIFLEFLLGIAAFAIWRRGIPPAVALVALLIGLAVLAGYALFGLGPDVDPDFLHVISGSSAVQRTLMWGLPWFAVLVGAVCLRYEVPLALRTVGDASYSIYLTHLFVITVVQQIALDTKGANPYLWVLGPAAMAIALGIVLHERIEVPLLRWLRNRAKRADTQFRLVRGI